MANRVIRWSGTESPDGGDDGHRDPRERLSRQRLRLTPRGRVVVALIALVVVVGGAAGVASLSDELPRPAPAEAATPPGPTAPASLPIPSLPRWEPPVVRDPHGPLTLASSPTAATHDVARALFDRAPVLVVAPLPVRSPGNDRDLLARWLAVNLQAPLVHAGPGLAPLVDELDVRTIVAVGLSDADDRLVRELVRDVRAAFIATGALYATPTEHDLRPDRADPTAARAAGDPFLMRATDGPPVRAWMREVNGLVGAARSTPPVVERTGLGLLARTGDASAWAVVTSAAVAGVRAVATGDPDPRVDPAVVGALGGRSSLSIVGTRSAWQDTSAPVLGWQLDTVRTGHVLPNGAQTLLPGSLLVALYGHPGGSALGALGEQPPAAAVERVRELAAAYEPFTDATVVPTFELIATVASGGPEATGDYSRRTPIATLRPWVDAAAEAGVYVVLDLQPGRSDFLTQAQEYEELLREPHVGLALDPEWRLGPGDVHLRRIGSVEAGEVNAVAEWLAGLVHRERLPQKLFLVHQFKLSMIGSRSTLQVAYPELAPVIQMDGQGGQGSKTETYRVLTSVDPPDAVWWGWKNFYDEDHPYLRSPEATVAVQPTPVFVSYQ